MRLPLVLAIVALAGCIGGAGPASQSASVPTSSDATSPGALPDDETGALTVTVTTTELEPVDGALVALADTNRSAATDATGTATIGGLAPGAYTVVAAKPGYRAREAEGRLAEIAAGETASLKLTLDPVVLVTRDTSYVQVLQLHGMIACAIDVMMPVGVQTSFTGYSSYCGRGVTAQGVTVGKDPNDNSSHRWQIAGPTALGWWLEAWWQPTSATLASQLGFSQQATFSCNVTCSAASTFSSGGGASPYRALVTEGTGKNITGKLGTDPTKYPRDVYTLVRGHCTAPCAAVTLNQKYEILTSVFYGRDAPTDYTALPT